MANVRRTRPKPSGWTTSQLLILGGLGLAQVLALGGLGVWWYLSGVDASPLPPLATQVSAQSAPPADSAAAQAPMPTLPPVWTSTVTPPPSPTSQPTATLEPTQTLVVETTQPPTAAPTVVPPTQPPPTVGVSKPSPTLQPPAPAPTATPAGPRQLAWLEGAGNADTVRFAAGAGQLQVQWNYAGSSTGGTVPQYEVDYHNGLLRNLETWYQNTLAIYQRSLEEAARDRDAYEVIRLQQDIQALHDEYSREVAAENQRYAEVQAAAALVDNTTFKVWLYRDSGGSGQYVGDITGPGSGSAYISVAGGTDYFFRIQAAGGWTMVVSGVP